MANSHKSIKGMNSKSLLKKVLVAAICCATFTEVEAKITLPSFFTDNMVLQQRTTLKLHGTASPQKRVTVCTGWDSKTYETRSDEQGQWSLNIQTPAAGGPYELTFSDGKKLTLKNVLVGEVWFCSGQSNMEMPLEGWGKIMNYQQEIADANYPSIRLLQVKHTTAFAPQDDAVLDFGWEECSPSTVPGFSSTAYFFARKLWEELKVPVGLVHSSWGGTPAEAWTSYEGLKQVNNYQAYAEKMLAVSKEKENSGNTYQQEWRKWMDRISPIDKGMKNGEAVWAAADYDDSQWKTMSVPGFWEKQGLEGFDGLAWFRKVIQIPSKYQGKELTLYLSKIDDDDIVYFNGTEIGATTGVDIERKYTIPGELVQSGLNTIAVRILDTGGDGGFIGASESMNICYGKKQVATLAGEWKYNVGAQARELQKEYASKPKVTQLTPGTLYNAMVNPFINFPVKGFIWYQGEANEGRAYEYTDLFQAMINDWRQKWDNKDLPFYFVQLAAFRKEAIIDVNAQWPYIREAQSAALSLAHTGMIVTTDIGDSKDIHPKNKQEVGRRLALLALKNDYGKSGIEASAPVYDSYCVEGNCIRIRFKNVGEGFLGKEELKGFSIAGTDHQFYSAQAKIEGDEIVISSPQVEAPAAVRYGWADYPICNLYGKNGLPVSPFRTDRW